MLPFGLTFQAPWVLLALLALPLLPRSSAWGWRVLALALLVVALAQPGLGRPSRDVAVLVDVSDSLGDRGISAARALDLSGLRTNPNVFYFGSDATSVATPSTDVPSFLDTKQTDLARALQVAQASGSSRALLISDGAESVGDALLALPGMQVDTLHLNSRDNVRLVDLLAPEQVSPFETVEVTAVVESDLPGRVTLRPTAAGQDLEPVTVDLKKGRQAVRFYRTSRCRRYAAGRCHVATRLRTTRQRRQCGRRHRRQQRQPGARHRRPSPRATVASARDRGQRGNA